MSRTIDNTSMPTKRLAQEDLQQQLLTFGRALKDAYELAGISKRQLAIIASLDRSAITQIEHGQRAPKFGKLLLLAQGANTTTAELLEKIGSREPTVELRDQLRETLAACHGSHSPGSAEPVERFAINLSWLRKHAQPGLSQEGLALEAEIDRSSPGGYETGRMAAPTLRTILKLAYGLQVSPSLLMEGVALTV